MMRHLICILFLAAGGIAVAGPDGYLRQGPPAALRFAERLPSPPPVNEVILAWNKPPVADPEIEEPTEDERLLTVLPVYLERVIDDLIRQREGRPTGVTNDTAQPPVDATSVVSSAELLEQNIPGVDVPTPGNTPAEEAQHLSKILGIFHAGNQGGGTRKPTVVVAPPVFLPPQPVSSGPSSRAVYRSP
jgi:hypothetical protein